MRGVNWEEIQEVGEQRQLEISLIVDPYIIWKQLKNDDKKSFKYQM